MLRIGITAFVVVAAGQAIAQQAGPDGGMLGAVSRGHQVELVIGLADLTVYILEHGKAHSTGGAKLRAVIAHGGKSTTVALADQGGKRLIGKLDGPLEKGASVLITGQDKHGDAITGRFVIK